MRTAGLALVASTPITAFASYAMFSVLFGEEHFEGTGLGYAVMVLPAAIGVVVAAWAHLGGKVPPRSATAATAVALGALFVVLGAWSLVRSGRDASIGGSLLVIFGIVALALGSRLRRGTRLPVAGSR